MQSIVIVLLHIVHIDTFDDGLFSDKIDGLIVETPHGAQVNTPVLFEVALSSDFDEFFGIKPGVHFMWRFGEEVS